MIEKFYFPTRILGYLLSLSGIFMHLHHQQAADPRSTNYGFLVVGIGFLFFFISYGIRAWIRFQASRNGKPNSPE